MIIKLLEQASLKLAEVRGLITEATFSYHPGDETDKLHNKIEEELGSIDSDLRNGESGVMDKLDSLIDDLKKLPQKVRV